MVSDRALANVFGLRPRAVALYGDVIRGFSVMVTCLALAALAGVYARTVASTVSTRHFQDFGTFYEGAKAARTRGGGHDASAIPVGRADRNLNPPHFHALMLPFTWLSPTRAFDAWLVVSGLALAASLVLVCRTLRLRGWPIAYVVVAAWASASMMATLLSGQVGLLLLLPFTFAWLRWRQGHEAEAGAWMGACASLKPFLLLFVVYFLLVRRTRAAGAALATCVGIFAAGLAWYGAPAYVTWIDQLMSVTWAEQYLNASLLGLVERTLSSSEWQQVPLLDWPRLVGPLWTASAGAVGVATLWRVRHLPADWQFLLVTVAALLLSPLGWVYYLWFLTPPLAAALRSEATDVRGWRLALLCAGLAGLFAPPPLVLTALQAGDGVGTATLGSAYCWALLALWGVAMAKPAVPPAVSSSP